MPQQYSVKAEYDWQGMWHVCWRTESYTEFWCGSLKEKDHLQDLGLDESIILKWIFKR